MLARLVLVHGHHCYGRIAYTLQYFFYKEIAFILPVALFGGEALFSGEPLYDSWLLVFWNIFFSALPVLVYGIAAKDLDDRQLLRHANLHRAYARNALLSVSEFARWTALGTWHALVAFFGVWLCFNDAGTVRHGREKGAHVAANTRGR